MLPISLMCLGNEGRNYHELRGRKMSSFKQLLFANLLFYGVFLLAAISGGTNFVAGFEKMEQNKPNIIIILADDMVMRDL